MNINEIQPLGTFVTVTTTLPSQGQASDLAKALIEKKLAACVQVIGPISSTYAWQGAIEVSDEWSCCAKTRSKWFDRVRDFIAEQHPYEVPEIVATNLDKISLNYARWLDAQLPTSS